MRVELFIEGINPVPWTAPEGAVGRKGKATFVQYHKSAALTAYQQAIRECIQEAYPNTRMFPSGVPLRGDFAFWRQLDSGTTTEGRRRRAHVADRTNLLKSTEDALQGVLYPNDSVIVAGDVIVVEQLQDTNPGVMVILTDTFMSPLLSVRTQEAFKAQVPAPPLPGNVWMQVL